MRLGNTRFIALLLSAVLVFSQGGKNTYASELNREPEIAIREEGEQENPLIPIYKNDSGSVLREAEESQALVIDSSDDDEHKLTYRDIPGDDDIESLSSHGKGYVPRLRAGEEVPASYTYEDFKSYMPPLRDQGQYGSCWAQTSMALAEISLRKKGLMADPNLSEVQLAYFSYHSKPDPLGGTEGDINSGIYSSGNPHYLDLGGNLIFSRNVLASWTGAADDEGILAYPVGEEGFQEEIDPSYAFKDRAHLINHYNVNINSAGSEENIKGAKRLIMKNGALGVSYYSDKSAPYYSTENNAFCDLKHDDSQTNHAVTIVGWDDNFAKENFPDNNRPNNNGAWLIRNSWATGSYENNYNYNGYFWMSYETKCLGAAYSFDFDTAYNYDHNYQYDGSMDNSALYANTAANVFTAKGSPAGETLKAVAFATTNSNVAYKVKVYKNLSGSDPSTGTLVGSATTEGVTSYPGYFTISLNQPVDLAYGERYAVAVELTKPGETLKFSVESNSHPAADWYKITAHAEEGESFYYENNKWCDWGIEGKGTYGNIRIKAFTDDKISAPIDLSAESTVVNVDDFTYTGSPVEPLVKVTGSDGEILNPSNYTLSFDNNIEPGTGQVIISAKPGNSKCVGTRTASFTIKPLPLNLVNWSFIEGPGAHETSHITVGRYSVVPISDIHPHFILKHNGMRLYYNTDYCLGNNEEDYFFDLVNGEGYYDFYLYGKGKYTGRKKMKTYMFPVSLTKDSSSSITGKFNTGKRYYTGVNAWIPNQEYNNGEPIKPAFTPTNGTRGDLTLGKDYVIKNYDNNVNPGTASVTVEGKGNYKDSKTFYFSILSGNLADPANTSLSGVAGQYYRGKPVEFPDLKVKFKGKTLTKDTDYRVSYSDNDKVGTGTVVIKGIGNYTGTVNCPFEIKEYVSVSGVSLGISGASLNEGESLLLKATVSPDNAVNREVTWSSSKEAVAAVDNGGLVRALHEGEAIITVETQDGNYKASCTIKVVPAPDNEEEGEEPDSGDVPVSEIVLDKEALTINMKDKAALHPRVLPENAANKNLIYESSNSGVAIIDKDGLITGTGKGEAVITVKSEDGGKTAKCAVTVLLPKYDKEVKPESAIVSGKLDISGRLETKAPENGKQRYRIASEDRGKAVINKKGILTPKRPGFITIYKERKNGSAWEEVSSCIIEIELPQMQKKAEAGFDSGSLDAFQFLEGVSYAPTFWISTNKNVAEVDSEGRIIINHPGRTNIIAVFGHGAFSTRRKYRTKLKILP